MPVKLPAPLLGTAEQAGPKSDIPLADELVLDDEAMGDDDAGVAAPVEDDVELHAAVPTARVAAMPDTAIRRRFFMIPP
jgi:hypothetical protein